jgi:hypothetical protein
MRKATFLQAVAALAIAGWALTGAVGNGFIWP